MTDDAELEAHIRERDATCVEIMFSSTVFHDRRTLLRLLDEARMDANCWRAAYDDARAAYTRASVACVHEQCPVGKCEI